MDEIGEINEKGSVIEWSMKNFLLLTNDVYDSPTFSFGNESWYFSIFLDGIEDNESDGCIHVYLNREPPGPPIRKEFILGIKTADGMLALERHLKPINRYEAEVTKWISRSEIFERKSDLLPSGTLTLICKMKDLESAEFSSLSNTVTTKCSYCNKNLGNQEDIQSHLRKCEDLPLNCPKCSDDVALKNWFDHKCQMTDERGTQCSSGPSKDLHESKVLHDYKELLMQQKECDVIITVKGQEFSAHRSILTARSSVFESTFRSDMKEKETGVVDIDDCDPSSFSDFLCFLYCGETEFLSEENVFSLFTTADKYDVQDLRNICLKFMKENISVDTFCDTMILALQYCESELITVATDFFIKHARKIVKTVQWQRFSADNPTQSNELIIKMLDAAAGPND